MSNSILRELKLGTGVVVLTVDGTEFAGELKAVDKKAITIHSEDRGWVQVIQCKHIIAVGTD